MEGKGIYLRRWSRMAELTVVLATVLGGAAVAITEKPDDSSGSSSPRRRDTRPLRFTPSVLFSVCLSRSLCWYPRFSVSTVSVPSLSTLLVSLSRFPSPFSAVFSLLLLPFGSLFIGAGGAGSTLPRPIAAHAWGARLLHCCGAGRGGQWRRRLRGTTSLSAHHEEVRVVSGFGFNRARGERERGRNKRKRTKTSLPLLRVQGKKKEEQCRLKRHCFVFPLFFLKCMKRRRFA